MKEIIYVFGALTDPDVDVLMRIGASEHLRVGDTLISEGEHPDAARYILA